MQCTLAEKKKKNLSELKLLIDSIYELTKFKLDRKWYIKTIFFSQLLFQLFRAVQQSIGSKIQNRIRNKKQKKSWKLLVLIKSLGHKISEVEESHFNENSEMNFM